MVVSIDESGMVIGWMATAVRIKAVQAQVPSMEEMGEEKEGTLDEEVKSPPVPTTVIVLRRVGSHLITYGLHSTSSLDLATHVMSMRINTHTRVVMAIAAMIRMVLWRRVKRVVTRWRGKSCILFEGMMIATLIYRH